MVCSACDNSCKSCSSSNSNLSNDLNIFIFNHIILTILKIIIDKIKSKIVLSAIHKHLYYLKKSVNVNAMMASIIQVMVNILKMLDLLQVVLIVILHVLHVKALKALVNTFLNYNLF